MIARKVLRGGESCALVAVEKGMVLAKALPESGGFLDQVSVITDLRLEAALYRLLTN